MGNALIITAGGSGSRAATAVKKQFYEIKGKPLLLWTLERFTTLKFITTIILTLPADQESEKIKNLIKFHYPSNTIFTVYGGITRQDSVFNALQSLEQSTDYVFIHDGVRPFVTSEEIHRIYEAAKKYDAVIPVTKVRNTLKKIEGTVVKETICRDNLYEVHTPQVFKYDLIMSCHKIANEGKRLYTDDAALLEACSHTVHAIEINSMNLKITYKTDLKVAEDILEKFTERDNADRFWL